MRLQLLRDIARQLEERLDRAQRVSRGSAENVSRDLASPLGAPHVRHPWFEAFVPLVVGRHGPEEVEPPLPVEGHHRVARADLREKPEDLARPRLSRALLHLRVLLGEPLEQVALLQSGVQPSELLDSERDKAVLQEGLDLLTTTSTGADHPRRRHLRSWAKRRESATAGPRPKQ